MIRLDAITGTANPKGCQARHPLAIRGRKCRRPGKWYTSVKIDGTKRVPVFRCMEHAPSMMQREWKVLPCYIAPWAVTG